MSSIDAQKPQNFLTLTAKPSIAPMTFLSLAPATSASYPRKPVQRAHVRADSIPEGSEAPALPRRSSSVSISGNGYRILKVAPVHWGEHQDEHKDDFHDVLLD